MHAMKILQCFGVVIVCLVLIEVSTESLSSCNSLDLRTILVHMRQTQSENKQLQDKHNMDIVNLRKELINSEALSSSKIKAVGSKIDYLETKNEQQLNSLQGQINESKADWGSQQYLIETLQEKIIVLQKHLNKSESQIFGLNFLINISATEVKHQVIRLDDLQTWLNKTNEHLESLKTSLKELNVTFQETNKKLEIIQDELKGKTDRTDGQWSDWSSWSNCSSASYRKTRNRACNNPAPSANGHMCEGNSMDVDICDLSFCLTATTTTTPTCPEDWLNFRSSCYLFSNNSAGFADAQAQCVQEGAHLAYVESKEENNFIKQHIISNIIGGSFWIGLSEHQEGVWKYTGTEKVATFFNWNPNEPSNDPSKYAENCVVMWVWFNYNWNNWQCYGVAKYICEKEM